MQTPTSEQWLGVAGLAIVVLLIIEAEKLIRRRRGGTDRDPIDPIEVLHGASQPVIHTNQEPSQGDPDT